MEQKTLEQALVQIIEKAVQGIDSATAFIQAELPDVVQQLLVWHAVESFIWFLLGLALIAAFWTTYLVKGGRGSPFDSKRGGVQFKETLTHDCYGYVTDLGWVVIIIGGTSHLVGTLLLLLNLTWLKILLAPKLYLLEYAARLMK